MELINSELSRAWNGRAWKISSNDEATRTTKNRLRYNERVLREGSDIHVRNIFEIAAQVTIKVTSMNKECIDTDVNSDIACICVTFDAKRCATRFSVTKVKYWCNVGPISCPLHTTIGNHEFRQSSKKHFATNGQWQITMWIIMCMPWNSWSSLQDHVCSRHCQTFHLVSLPWQPLLLRAWPSETK